MNNSIPPKSIGVPTPTENSRTMVGHLVPKPQPQPQTHGASIVPGHIQLSEPQAQVLAQAQYVQAHAQAQAQAAHSQFKAHLQAQNATAGNAAAQSPAGGATPGSVKRTTQRPPSKQSGQSNSNAVALFKTMELAPAVRRKRRKLPENKIPDQVTASVPESALYAKLCDFEVKIDAILARKKQEIEESLKKPPCVRRTLRIYVYNTFSNQEPTDPDKKSVEAPSWSLKIIGKILQDGKDPMLAGGIEKLCPKFSSFFKKLTIYLDASLYPDNHVILWESARSPALHEGFEIKRKGDKESTVRIRMEMHYMTERYRLSPILAEVLGIEVDTKPIIMSAIWHYVKSKKLQNQEDNAVFVCDLPLRKVFGEEKMKLSMLSQKIGQHLSPLQPIYLEHRIKLSGSSSAATCYDVQVDMPLLLESERSAVLENMGKNQDVSTCDEVISAAIKKIKEHHLREAFFLGFSRSPGEFINTLIVSQKNDLKLFAGDTTRDAEKEHHSEFYNQPWVEDSIIRYLNRKSSGSEGSGS